MGIIYTRQELIDEALRFQKENGRIPFKDDMMVFKGYPSFELYKKEFGSWSSTLMEIFGYIPKRCRNVKQENKQYVECYTREELIEGIHRFSREHNGKIPFYKDMKEIDGYPSGNVYVEVFGSWNNSLIAAGCELNKHCRDPNDTNQEYLIEALYRFEREKGHSPVMEDMRNINGYPSNNLYVRVFGSWENAKAQVKFETDIDTDFFKFENLNLRKYYIIGYAITDGNVYNNYFRLISAIKDVDNLSDIHKYMKIDTKLQINNNSVGSHGIQKMCRVEKYCEEWFEDLALYGVVPNKGKITYIPFDHLKTTEDEAAIMRGIFDGDGNIAYKKGSYDTFYPVFRITGTKRLCEDYGYLLEKNCEIYYYVGEYKNRNSHYLAVSGITSCKRIYDFLYGHENFYIKRKKERFEQLVNGTFTKENDPYYKN